MKTKKEINLDYSQDEVAVNAGKGEM